MRRKDTSLHGCRLYQLLLLLSLDVAVLVHSFTYPGISKGKFGLNAMNQKFAWRQKVSPSRSSSRYFELMATTESEEKSRTQRLMETVPQEQQTANAGGFSSYEGLLRVDATWSAIRNMKEGADAGPAPEFVKEVGGQTYPGEVPFDVVVCGGTLGIFQACALQMRGLRVAVVERGVVRGRNQDWNISKEELMAFVKEGVLSEEELDEIISIEFNPMRAGFKLSEKGPGFETYIEDVLNIGVRPVALVEAALKRFKEYGGTVMENVSLDGIQIFDNAAVLSLSGKPELATRLMLDCMGMGSPIVRQVRWGQKPDGVCLVVGSCGRGYKEEENKAGDIIYANSPIMEKERSSVQYFWEAFPAGSGPTDRTTYMFAYMDAHPDRPSLMDLMEDYWDLLPKYQGLPIEEQQLLRVLFGFFPTYKDSPLLTSFDRVLQIGDASGIQSPLSFGGFVCLTRHISRLTTSIFEALDADRLTKSDLNLINAYQPALSGAWMFQKAMSVEVGQKADKAIIINTLKNNFAAMESLGDPVLRPFLQDVVQFNLLFKTLAKAFVIDPLSIPPLVLHVGIPALVEWVSHFSSLCLFTILYNTIGRWKENELSQMSKGERYTWSRKIEEWKYGSGLDYEYSLPSSPMQK